MRTKPSLIAIDPGFREIGVAHFLNDQLVDFGVKSLRRSGRSHEDVLCASIGQWVADKRPEAIALALHSLDDRRSVDVSPIFRCLKKLALPGRVPIFGIADITVKEVLSGDRTIPRRKVAEVVAGWFPELKYFRGTRRPWREWYYQNMFDAVAAGLTYLALAKQGNLADYELPKNEIHP